MCFFVCFGVFFYDTGIISKRSSHISLFEILLEEVTLAGLRLYVVFHKDVTAVFFAETHCSLLVTNFLHFLFLFMVRIPRTNVHN